jgi:hypothetical protein
MICPFERVSRVDLRVTGIEPDDVRPAAAKRAGERVGLVAKVCGGLEDSLAGRLGNAGAAPGGVVEHHRNGDAVHARPLGNIR